MICPLAVLRPAPCNLRTATMIEQAGGRSLLMPLFEVRALPWSPPRAADHDALVLTSANAVRLGGDGLDALRSLPVHAVGGATARAATEAGFRVVSVGKGGVEELSSALATAGVIRALHLTGADHRSVSERVAHTIAVYESVALDPGPAALSELRRSVTLLHSPRAGAWLRTLLDRHRIAPHTMAIAAISPAAADAAGAGWRAVTIATQPTDATLTAAALALARDD